MKFFFQKTWEVDWDVAIVRLIKNLKTESERKTMLEIIKLYMSKIWSFLKPIVAIFLSEMGTVLAQSAMDAVVAVATSYGAADADKKRKMAFQLIKADLAKKGIEAGASSINLAIELAVQKMKEDQK